MDAHTLMRTARNRANLSQRELAARAGTSQAAISAYEGGHKDPSIATLSRILAAAGWRLALEAAAQPVVQPSGPQLAQAARTLTEVLALAGALPTSHDEKLLFPALVQVDP